MADLSSVQHLQRWHLCCFPGERGTCLGALLQTSLAGAGLRIIGTNVSPSLGYRDTPALNLTGASPLPGAPPTPIPAGSYDVALNYTSRGNAQCQNSSHLTPSAFLIQVCRLPKITSLIHILCRRHLSLGGFFYWGVAEESWAWCCI